MDDELMANDSKSEGEKFGFPHPAHRHDILDDADALYMGLTCGETPRDIICSSLCS